MCEEIEHYLCSISLKNSERKARQMVAEQFGGTTTSNHRYVMIEGVEYKITKNPDNVKCGWDIQAMIWEHGDNFKFCNPY